MNYLFGKTTPAQTLTAASTLEIIREGRRKCRDLQSIPTTQILETLHAIGRAWIPGGDFHVRAMAALPDALSFSREMIDASLAMIPGLFDRGSLERRLRLELGDPEILDRFVRKTHFEGRLTAIPLGVVTHITAGNVFLGAIDSLLMGFLTKNVSILKTSTNNQAFPALFAESVRAADPRGVLADKFAIVHWIGGTLDVETVIKTESNAIVAWGGEDMVRSYRHDLGLDVKLLEHGPKISFQVICADAARDHSMDDIARRMAREICLWDQAACASPQNAFIQRGIDETALLDALARAMTEFPLPRGVIDADESVEILKEKFRAKASSLTETGAWREGHDFVLHLDPKPGLRPSALNRTLVLKRFDTIEDLGQQLLSLAPVLQSCSYLATGPLKRKLLRSLAMIGTQRFAPLGSLMDGMEGAPHDGHYILAELTRLVPDESRPDTISFVNDAIDAVPVYGELYNHNHIHSTRDLIPIDSTTLSRHSLTNSYATLRRADPTSRHGYVFSSGGTSGQPKYAFFTNNEFDQVGEMLAKGYRAQGIRPGDRCANLFIAGNMWSSFMAVDRALRLCDVIQLPIGGTADPAQTLSWLRDFQPHAVFGLPSLIVSLANQAARDGIAITIPVICYAGEHLNALARDLLRRVFKTERFFSAGYASVDAGPIGYQCAHCGPREHHLYDNYIHMEILDGEAVVTSLARRAMPIIHYRTGDHVEWVASDRPCPCGDRGTRFQLLGRIDGQINIWSARVLIADIETALHQAGLPSPIFQIEVAEATDGSALRETMTITTESLDLPSTPSDAAIRSSVFHHCHDLQVARDRAFLDDRLIIRHVASGGITRVARTGKVRPLIDKRHV